MKTYTNIFRNDGVPTSTVMMAKRGAVTPVSKPSKGKKLKGKKGKVEEKPMKKKGRPSNEELRQRAAEKRAADLEVRKALLQRQEQAEKVALSNQNISAPIEDDIDGILTLRHDLPAASVRDPNWIPPWPVFLPGARVQATYDGILYTGTVYSDDVELPTIRVKWDDGSSQHAAKKNLTRERKKYYINVYKA
mgnify:CR=1 FL=1